MQISHFLLVCEDAWISSVCHHVAKRIDSD